MMKEALLSIDVSDGETGHKIWADSKLDIICETGTGTSYQQREDDLLLTPLNSTKDADLGTVGSTRMPRNFSTSPECPSPH